MPCVPTAFLRPSSEQASTTRRDFHAFFGAFDLDAYTVAHINAGHSGIVDRNLTVKEAFQQARIEIPVPPDIIAGFGEGVSQGFSR